VHESANNLPVALKSYERAAAILKRAQKRVPVELWNNLGALRLRLGKLESAEQAFSAALRLCESEVICKSMHRARSSMYSSATIPIYSATFY